MRKAELPYCFSFVHIEWHLLAGPWPQRTFSCGHRVKNATETWKRWLGKSQNERRDIAEGYAVAIYGDTIDPPDGEEDGPAYNNDMWMIGLLTPLVGLLDDPTLLTRANIRQLWCNGHLIGTSPET
jgi:hypothetical protein